MAMDLGKIQEIINRWSGRKDFLIEMLQDIQDEYHYLPRDVLIELARVLEIPLNQVYEAATFYKAFSLTPKGRFTVSVCQGTACHVQGADPVLRAFERELEVKLGETDKNLDFTLETVRCLGCCGLAPVVTVNQDIYAKMEPGQVAKLVERYRKTPRRPGGIKGE
ncbi:MAG: NADH-quinone oxidoreductase subunit NuoE family protein [Candidatus Aminicenantales bacterium]